MPVSDDSSDTGRPAAPDSPTGIGVTEPQLTVLLPLALRSAQPDCPELAVLVEADGVVAAHVSGCMRCRAVLAGAQAPLMPVPEPSRWVALLSRARGVFRPRPADLLRIVVRVVDGALDLIDATGRLVPSHAMRSRHDDGVLVSQQLGAWDVQTHASYSQGGGFAILVDMTLRAADSEPHGTRPGTAHLAGDVEPRITLLRGERELASHVADRGRVMLSGVRPGAYRLQIAHGASDVGGIELELQT